MDSKEVVWRAIETVRNGLRPGRWFPRTLLGRLGLFALVLVGVGFAQDAAERAQATPLVERSPGPSLVLSRGLTVEQGEDLVDWLADVPHQPDGVTVSHYVNWLRESDPSSIEIGRELACQQESATGGLVILALGRQRGVGASSFAPSGQSQSYDFLVEGVVAYAEALSECRGDVRWVVSLATSNYNHDIHAMDVEQMGREWGEFVAKAASRAPSGVQIVAGNDLEPGWGDAASGFAWKDGYRSVTDIPIVWLASADGCPQTSEMHQCAKGWTSGQLADIVFSDGQDIAAPQLYTRNGAQLRQWAQIARIATREGFEPRFAGVLTQEVACQQVDDPNCPQLDLPNAASDEMFRFELSKLGLTTPVGGGTDIRWG